MRSSLLRATLLAAVGTTTALAAQASPRCAYIPDSDATAGTCNVFPFQFGAFTYQALMPASFFDGPGAITSIAFAPCSTGTQVLTNVRVRLGHTAAAALDCTFANNLNSPTGGVEVLNRASLSWNLVANTWTDLPLDRGFAYNGVDNLVIEVRVDGSAGVGGGFHRTSTIERAYDTTTGSATVCTTSGSLAALKMRVCFGTYFHSPDNDPTVGTCNVFPLEQSSMTYQQLIPASDLGGPGTIRNIGFAPCGTGSQSYSNIDVRIAHTTASTLDTTFANNLQSPTGGVLVLSGAHSTSYTANTWYNLGLTGGFAYNGTDNVVVEIRVDGGTSTGGHHRSSNRGRVFATGSGATTGTGDTAALKIRLCVECTRNVIITPFSEGCGPTGSGLGIGASAATRGVLGETFDLLMRFGPTMGPGAFVVGTTNSTPYPFPIPGAPGCFLRNDIFLVLYTAFDPAGFSTPVPFRTPFDLRLCGLTLYYQGAAVWPGINPLGLASSNQLILTFGVQ